ncbi:hypothetical protein DEAC_c31090 [Desulfosporosinus acididurans]|uniref:Uncharacterized protein n=1 Tax=Desulfosporosinus acididurans TaxID=476652 RepID=A0A0J1FPA5_9FIRM|nr:WYL domain-containing protein [Desulfosporosinus acididurans]KLU65142.1 hypothetical protein DEAC_c31090 [Desulfosporosinus acididurans]
MLLDPVDRIHKIMELLAASSQGLTISELARICEVDVSVIKNDLEQMEWKHPLFPLWTNQYEFEEGQDREEDEEENEDGKELYDPAYSDEARWYFRPDYEQLIPVYFKPEEFFNLAELLTILPESSSVSEILERQVSAIVGDDLYKHQPVQYTKGNLDPYLLDEQLITVVQNAIEQEKMITFDFHNHETEVGPLGLVYYSRLRRWYIVAVHKGTVKNYYVKNVSNISISTQPFQCPEDFSVNEWLQTRWGTEFGDSFHVKIKFKNQSQTVSKVKKDVAHRVCQLTTEDNGDLLYEDTIIGRNEFLTWLLGFGATAEILEPADLRGQMRKIITEVLAGYNEIS